MSSIISTPPRTLADVLPGGLARNVALIIGGACLVGLTAQVSFPLPFTPVPVTLQTFSVLLVGAVLGARRGALSMGLYAVAGVAGIPWFSEQRSGWAFGSFGYIVGFVLASYIVGLLAERRADRSPGPTLAMMALGNLVIYAVGTIGLMILVLVLTGKPVSLSDAVSIGVLPFLLFDAVKIIAAAWLLPQAWRLVNARRR